MTWCLNSSLPLSVGVSSQDEAMDVARFALWGVHCHYVLSLLRLDLGSPRATLVYFTLTDYKALAMTQKSSDESAHFYPCGGNRRLHWWLNSGSGWPPLLKIVVLISLYTWSSTGGHSEAIFGAYATHKHWVHSLHINAALCLRCACCYKPCATPHLPCF